MKLPLAEIAAKLRRAREDHMPIAQITSMSDAFSLADAYEVQRILYEQALAEGKHHCGYKMGLTSPAKQVDVGVFEPIRGFLLSEMEWEKGRDLEMNRFIHPRVEPEVAVVLKDRLYGSDVSLRDVVSRLAFIGPACEIVDSRFENFKFTLPDVIADNSSAAGFMVGSGNLLSELSRLRLMGIAIRKNGVIVETGAPAAVLGDPLLSVVALARSLAKEEKALEPGKVILTGGITTSVSFTKGDVLEVIWPGEILKFRAV